MTMPIKSGCVIAFFSLLSACGKAPPPDTSTTTKPPPETVVAYGPQVPEGEPSDYQIVMKAREGKKGAAAAGASEEEVKWEDIDGLSLPVDKMGCAIQEGVPTHCHMIVEQNQTTGELTPDRTLMIVKTGSKYSLGIVSLAVPDQVIACIGLDLKNPQTIEGTCSVTGDPATGLTHSFSASIERLPNRKIRVHFAYRHGPFDSAEPGLHNGDGHATET